MNSARTAVISTTALVAILAGAGTAQTTKPLSEMTIEQLTAEGNGLVQRLCTNCHVTPTSTHSGQAGVPTMRVIANRPTQTGTKIRNALINPDHTMPAMNLSRDEIIMLVAYLDSLRTDRSTPLFDAATTPPKTATSPKS